MKSADDIKRYFNNAEISTNANADKAILEQLNQIRANTAPASESNRWSKIMHSNITKLATAAAAVFITLIILTVFTSSTPVASATEILENAIVAISDVHSVHIKAQMRTRPRDNFANIGLHYDFSDIEMWKRTYENNFSQWRVDKVGRSLIMDGNSTLLLIGDNHGKLVEKPRRIGCYDSWMGRLLNVHELLDNELKRAKKNKNCEFSLWNETINGKEKIILEVEMKASVPEDDYLRNKFIEDSNHIKVYQFDVETDLLEAMDIYVYDNDQEILVFETIQIDYNMNFDDSIFAIDLREDMVWYLEPEILHDNKIYQRMTPKETATAFFQALANEDWDEVLIFKNYSRVPDWLKNYGGIEIISIGEPFQSEGYIRGKGWFVPYEIKFKNGRIKKHNISLRNDNKAKRYVVDGGL